MLKPNYIQELPKTVTALYTELENEIITDIARRIAKANYITPTAEWQIYRMQELSKSYEQITKEIANLTAKSQKEVERLLYESAVTSLEYDDKIYNEAFKQGLTPKQPLPLLRSPQMVEILKAGIVQTNALMKNFTQTTAINAQRQLGEALDLAYLQITSGVFTPQQAIRQAVKTITNNGIKAFNYKSGHTDQIDVAVRRAIITGCNQVTGKLQDARADEMELELVEVTSHFGARPSHAEWQGKIYCRNGSHSKYPDFVTSTGYGTGDGLMGWNCAHSFYPYYDGLSSPSFEQYDKKESDKAYEQSQIQRKYERAIREEKRRCTGYNASGDTEMFNKHSVKLKEKEQHLKDFLADTGRYRDKDRESVLGFGHSVSSKAVWVKRKVDIQRKNAIIISEIKNCGIRGKVNLTPTAIDFRKLSFDDIHINKERSHNVTEQEAKEFIQNAKISVTTWKGRFENYFSPNGATYVDLVNQSIRTAYSKSEFDDVTRKVLEVLNKYGK